MTDIEIARKVKPKKIVDVAKKLGLKSKDIELYGDYKAKIKSLPVNLHKNSNLVLVTAITPTASGNGKTTVSIGLADALALQKQKVCLALREPSLGPVFGMKGGATGGGYSQIIPMEDINLHFNGDFHAITSANNLLCSLIDNHIFQGNELNINKVLFKRCLDLNDRALREITVSKSNNATPREDGFIITAASEIMAILCLCTDLTDLKKRLGNIIVALNNKENPIYAKDLHAEESMTILLKDAIKPNLVQTLAGTPAIVHGGPFANIAHGCNSVIATKIALSLSDYCITEAGFGADLGAEKFFDLKCRLNNLKPNCVVLIATVKALKLHGGVNKNELDKENVEAVQKGLDNLYSQIDMIKNVFKLPLIVTLNKFTSDTDAEIKVVEEAVKNKNCEFSINNVWAEGGKGAIDLANKVRTLCKSKNEFSFAYNLESSVKNKIKDLASKIYGTNKIKYTEEAEESIKTINKLKLDCLPIVVAKTQYSLSDDAQKLGAPKNFELTIKDVEVRAGAGFLVVILGAMLLMPGLSKNPAAINMKIDKNEVIEGLY
jgi:formate--tetrahydrofolate ligase